MRALLATSLLLVTATALAAPPDPASRPHPRMLVDQSTREMWRAMAKLPAGPVIGAIRLCDEARTTKEHARALYQGAEWARVLGACLVAYVATDSKDHAATAIRYFDALLDDLDTLDDGRGGDDAASRDHGYAIRNLGPYTALAYDWLHDHPLMTPALKAKARARWAAWLGWYAKNGYRPDAPASNYYAGYLTAATLIAVAQAGDAGADGNTLWSYVTDTMWGTQMAHALSSDGVLAGGNWPEGWQYGPLSIAEYALAARVMRENGVEVRGISEWLSSVMRHFVYALNPAGGVYPGGDTEVATAYLPPHVLTLASVALGDAKPQDKAWARGELVRLRLVDRDYFLFDALAAAVNDKPVAPPRTAWPTWYVASNTGTLYARTRWDDAAIWFAAECHAAIPTDHRLANAGTFVLSRGVDDVIVDPTPYGSQSTLTSNAPTVVSPQLPNDYTPSQGLWSKQVGYDFVTARSSGVVAARCDYADAYRIRDKPSDVPAALRDFVLIPSSDGTDAALVVVDRANTSTAERYMALRFRTPARLALDGATARAHIGGTQLAIAPIGAPPGTATLSGPTGKTCYRIAGPKGQCDAARIPVSDYRVIVPGPQPTAVHLISASGSATATGAPVAGAGYAGVKLGGIRDATVIWKTTDAPTLAYTAPPGTHVILDATDRSQITASPSGTGCAVNVSDLAAGTAKPLVASLDAACRVTLDPEAAAASTVTARPVRARPIGTARSPRSGCCSAEAAPGQSFAMIIVVAALLARRRRR